MEITKVVNGLTPGVLGWVVWSLGLCGVAFAEPTATPAAQANHGPMTAEMPEKSRAFFKTYCTECHGEEKQKGKLRLDNISLTLDSLERANGWQKILTAVNSGDMPPDDAKQADKNEKAEFLDILSNTMVVARKVLTDQGGKIAMRRLNRREYQNTLRELLGVEMNVSTLPADGSPDTFDTIGSSLFMSPDQFQLYRELGRKALDQAFQLARQEPKVQKFHVEAEAESTPAVERTLAEFVSIRKRYQQWVVKVDAAAKLPENQKLASELRQKTKESPSKFYLGWEQIKGAPSPKEFGFPDAVDANMMNGRWEHYIPQGVDYLTRPKSKTGTLFGIRDLPNRWATLPLPNSWPSGVYKVRVRMAATEEGPEERRFVDFLSGSPFSQVVSTHQVTGTMEKPQILEFPLAIDKDSPRRFQFGEKGVLGNADGKGTAHQVFQAGYEQNKVGPEYAVWLDWIEVEGPFPPPKIAKVLSLIRTQLARFESKELTARDLLGEFAERVLRGRALDPEFLDKLVGIYEARCLAGGTPTEAIKEPLSVLLASPSFLYLTEPSMDGKRRPLNSLELATRLSFFLWSAPPDQELVSLAKSGELQKPEVLAGQVDRLLADEMSRGFVSAFVSQWLGLARLDFFEFNTKLYPDFDLPTKAACRAEVLETFSNLLREKGSLKQLLKSDSVVINGLLARYYEIPGVVGDEFRRVLLPVGSPRGGLLGMAAIMAMGGNGEQTSPVERGAWVLRKLLHDPPPPPPANVPQLNRLASRPLTTKERIAQHQEDPQCTQCHRKIDPIGFGLENFDAVGKWRTVDGRPGIPANNKTVDPSGSMFKGPAFRDYFELRDLLSAKPERFARGFTEALVEYALGRSFGFSDEDLAAEILNRTASKDFAVSEFIYALVATKAFQSK